MNFPDGLFSSRYQFRPVWGLPNASPFCMKLETYLRMAALPYHVAKNADVRKAPKKKLPFIDDGGKVIADSGFIRIRLHEGRRQSNAGSGCRG